jgi:ParB family chromosome partitioning protein
MPGVTESPVNGEAEVPAVEALTIDVHRLDPNPAQPRDNITTKGIVSLTESIRRSGLLQPITVRRHQGRFQIIAGERRWRAAQAAGVEQIPAVVREATDEQMLEWALIENIQREDLNAIDRAKAYRELSARFDLKPEEVGARLSEDRTTVVNYLRLLELPGQIQEMVAEGRLTMGHARCLLGVEQDTQKLRLAESTAHNELSVRALEEIVRREKKRSAETEQGETKSKPVVRAHVRDLQRRFEEAVKTKVTIREGKKKGNGRIVIEFYSLEDFDRIAALMGVTTD